MLEGDEQNAEIPSHRSLWVIDDTDVSNSVFTAAQVLELYNELVASMPDVVVFSSTFIEDDLYSEPPMRVSRIVVSQTVQLKQYEPYHVEAEVLLGDHEVEERDVAMAWELANSEIEKQIRQRRSGTIPQSNR